MNRNYRILVVILIILIQISCQRDNNFDGYNDILVNSSLLLWDSSINKLKDKYQNILEIENNKISNDEIIVFKEDKLEGKIKYRYFAFVNKKLYRVEVGYGIYDSEKLNLLKKDLDKNYGIYQIENHDKFEKWNLKNNDNTEIIFQIDKFHKDYNIVSSVYFNSFIGNKYPLKYRTKL
jgi:hypothetical protein